MNRLASPAELRASLLRWSLFIIPAIVLLGWLSGSASGSLASNSWFVALDKPGFLPSAEMLPVIWACVYVLIGLGLAIVCSSWGARWRTPAIIAFAVQFVLCLAWSPVFFIMHKIGLALGISIVLLAAAGVTTVCFWKVRAKAGMLMLPFLVWLLFLILINFQLWQLNPDPFDDDANNAVQRIEL